MFLGPIALTAYSNRIPLLMLWLHCALGEHFRGLHCLAHSTGTVLWRITQDRVVATTSHLELQCCVLLQRLLPVLPVSVVCVIWIARRAYRSGGWRPF